MTNWKRVGLIAAVGALMYTTWCASPLHSQGLKPEYRPVSGIEYIVQPAQPYLRQ